MKIKQKLKHEIGRGIALDIDDTIAATREVWAEKLFKIFGNPENISFEELIRKYGYIQKVPYWQGKNIQDWMVEKRFSNEFQTEIPVILHADSIVRKINEDLPIALYLTARPEKVIPGTLEWLKMHNFPIREIIASPDEYEFEKLSQWKANILENLFPEVIGIIEDNPGVIEAVSEDYQGIIIFFDWKNTPLKPTSKKIIRCENWLNIYEAILDNYYQVN